MQFEYFHPFGPPLGVKDQIYTMFYTGITLNEKPHGMGLLELRSLSIGDKGFDNFYKGLKFKFYGQFVNGEIQGGPALMQME
jgi:hypothetical protein